MIYFWIVAAVFFAVFLVITCAKPKAYEGHKVDAVFAQVCVILLLLRNVVEASGM